MTTLSTLKEELKEYKDARRAILQNGQSYTTGKRMSVNRADLATINAEIKRLETRISVLSSKGALSHSSAVFGGSR